MSLRNSRLTSSGGGGGFTDGSTALAGDGTVSEPSYAFQSDPDTGWYLAAAGDLRAAIGGADAVRVVASGLRLPDGTANIPSISFIGDTDTGIYRTGPTLGLTTAGTLRVLVSSTAVEISADSKLEINNRTGDPNAEANKVAIYSKDVASSSELFARNEAGAVKQLTGVGQFAYLRDVKASNTHGGDATAGSWETRTLNEETHDPDGIVTLSGNAFTLLGGKKYRIRWEAPAFGCTIVQTRLYDVTGAAMVTDGEGTVHYPDTSNNQGLSKGDCIVEPAASNAYRIEQQVGSTKTVIGMGHGAAFGIDNVFARVWIEVIG